MTEGKKYRNNFKFSFKFLLFHKDFLIIFKCFNQLIFEVKKKIILN